MPPARWSPNRTYEKVKKIPTEWSAPHQSVMRMLGRYHILISGTEERINCKPCGNTLCHHQWKTDIILASRNIIVEVHRPQNDEAQQEMRKHCLENDGWIVIPIDDATAFEFPEIILPKIMRLEQLREAGLLAPATEAAQ